MLKSIGKLTGVEVEPDLLTAVLDELALQHAQVLYGICPGAGGYDSLCLLVDPALPTAQLQTFFDGLRARRPEFESFRFNVGVVSAAQDGFRVLLNRLQQ